MTILEEAKEICDGSRTADYGHPAEAYTKIARRWSERLGTPVTAKDVCLCLIDMKLVRQMHSHKRDNLVDIVG